MSNLIQIYRDYLNVIPIKIKNAYKERKKRQILDRWKIVAEKQFKEVKKTGNSEAIRIWEYALDQLIVYNNPYFFITCVHLNKTPVGIEEFVDSDEFLGNIMDVWPKVREDVVAMNPYVFAGDDYIDECCLGGSTGTGKTSASQITILYQLYLFSCFDHPQLVFNLTKSTQIIFILQSVTRSITDKVIFRPLHEMFTSMEYVRKWVQYDRKVRSEIRMGNNVSVVQLIADSAAVAGQAIAGGIIDEVNFMSVVEQSRRIYGARGGSGGTFDQAEILHRTVTRRIKRSFSTRGPKIGTLCVISSIRHKDDFLNRRIREIRENKEEDHKYISLRKQFEVQPHHKFSKETCRILIGTETYDTRVLEDDEQEGVDFPNGAHIEVVPIDYKGDFINDPVNACRDILGLASESLTPLIRNKAKLIDAVDRWRKMNLNIWVDKTEVNLAYDYKFPEVLRDLLPRDRSYVPRFVGIDLSKNRDQCGIAIIKPLTNVYTSDDNDTPVESLPRFLVELVITIIPNNKNEINIPDVRRWILSLKKDYGFYVHSAVYDGFSSTESIQIFRKEGVRSYVLSVDKTWDEYFYLRELISTDRIAIVDNPNLLFELVNLEENSIKAKIEHKKGYYKDTADAVCRAINACARTRIILNSAAFIDGESTEGGYANKADSLRRRSNTIRRRKSTRRNSVRRNRDEEKNKTEENSGIERGELGD